MRIKSNAPTPRQLDCLRAIAEYQAKHGRSPTMRDLMSALGVKAFSVPYQFLEQLGSKGYIKRDRRFKRDERLARTIVILEAGRKALAEAK